MSDHYDDALLRSLGWCAAAQVFGMVVAFVGAYYTGSYTLNSDGWHMAADVLPAVVTLITRSIIVHSHRNSSAASFRPGITATGMFNAATLIVAGAIAVREATAVVADYHRQVHFGWALMAAVLSLATNWFGHRMAHRHSHSTGAHDSRFDIFTLDRHLLIDTIGSALAILFLLLYAVYRVSWWDTAGGMLIGWAMIVYGIWLVVKGSVHLHKS